ncbi:MAG: response regulator transcription factor [Sphingomonas sp.]|uniref:LytR/AlgR family response regulator transcription factor n=1 Tax=Sphingomonas sp. TaxID=28214 RepID=UPI0025E4CD04|nr:LytTR family DNA-binding domain-containing protein [Sphingomonas sp.]MBX3565529.1 response regulator transcription factor [Sphingomonas sp.]
MIRLLLCDDEPLAIQRLGEMLGRFADVEIIGIANDGRDAIERIIELKPDAVLLDIEMPYLDGFDVIEEVARRGEACPLVVFATAFPRFATMAFETGAIDFLTKPVRLARLETTIQRIRAALDDRSARSRLEELSRQLEALRRTGSPATDDPHIWIQRRGETVRVSLQRIDWIRAEAEYVRIVVGQASYLHREPLSEFMTRLDEKDFLRVHRSLIVNRHRVVAVRRNPTGSYRLMTEDGTDLPVGRSYRKAVRALVAATPELETRGG